MKIENNIISTLSEVTMDNIARAMKKFNTYDEFLKSVNAISNDDKAYEFHLNELEKYEKVFVSNFYDTPLNDTFYFSDKVSIKEVIIEGVKKTYKKTGYFIPKIFWDKIERERKPFAKYDPIITLEQFLTKHPDKVSAWENLMGKKWNGKKFV